MIYNSDYLVHIAMCSRNEVMEKITHILSTFLGVDD